TLTGCAPTTWMQTGPFPDGVYRERTVEMLQNAAIKNHWNREGLPQEMRALMERAGFRLKAWEDVTEELAAIGSAPDPALTIQGLVAGQALATITEVSR